MDENKKMWRSGKLFSRTHCFVFLLLIYFTAHATAITPTEQAQNLIRIAYEVKQSSVSDKTLKMLGNTIQSFLKNPVNKAIINSPEGRELKKIQLRLGSYFHTKNKLSKCIEDKKSRLQFSERIGQEILRGGDCETIPATFDVSKLNNFDEVLKALESSRSPSSGDANWDDLVSFRSRILNQGFTDALKTYIDLQYRYQPGSKKINVEKIFDELFEVPAMSVPGAVAASRFDSADKFEIINNAKIYLRGLEKNIKPTSAEETRKFLNSKIRETENAFKKIPPPPFGGTHQLVPTVGSIAKATRKNRSGETWTKEDEKIYQKELQERKKLMENFNRWSIASLGNTMQAPNGTLLLTKTISKYFTPVTGTNDVKEKTWNKYHFKQIPDIRTVNTAIEEAKKEVKRYGQYLSKMNHTKTVFSKSNLDSATIKNQLVSLARSAPATLSQVMMKNPEYAPMVCEAINTANAEQKRREKNHDIYVYGGYLVGGVLMVSGVGTAAGSVLLTGTSTGAILSTISYSTSILGAAYGLGEIAYLSERETQLKRDHDHLRAALFATGSTDIKGWAETQKLMDEIKDTNFELSLTAGFLIYDTAKVGIAIHKLGHLEKIRVLKNSEFLMKELNTNPNSMALVRSARGRLGEKDFSIFVSKLVTESRSENELLKLLNSSVTKL